MSSTVTASSGLLVIMPVSESVLELLLEHMSQESGARAGRRLAEHALRVVPRPQAQVDAIKLLCKECWVALFRKQADKLQTNKQGLFYIQDVQFRWARHVGVACGWIEGFLRGLGLESVVTAEPRLPVCVFTVQILPSDSP